MSVLIKGMKMPKSCEECRLYEDEWCLGREVDDSWSDFNTRWKNCPLIEIPTPHGRLIDWDLFNSKLDIQYAEGRGKALAPTILEEEE